MAEDSDRATLVDDVDAARRDLAGRLTGEDADWVLPTAADTYVQAALQAEEGPFAIGSLGDDVYVLHTRGLDLFRVEEVGELTAVIGRRVLPPLFGGDYLETTHLSGDGRTHRFSRRAKVRYRHGALDDHELVISDDPYADPGDAASLRARAVMNRLREWARVSRSPSI